MALISSNYHGNQSVRLKNYSQKTKIANANKELCNNIIIFLAISELYNYNILIGTRQPFFVQFICFLFLFSL